MIYYSGWGNYQRGPEVPYDVAMAGTPDNVNVHGVNMTQAHNNNIGYGVGFESQNDDGTSVLIHLSLIGYSVDYQQTPTKAIMNGYYVQNGKPYNWYYDIELSYDDGVSYQPHLNDVQVASHDWRQVLAYNVGGSGYIGDWLDSIIDYSELLTLPDNFTHLRITVKSDNPIDLTWNVYTREEVTTIPTPVTFKPYAIRKSGTFKTVDVDSGFNEIRSNGNWLDVSEQEIDDIGNENVGLHRIRKNGKWLQTGKLGVD